MELSKAKFQSFKKQGRQILMLLWIKYDIADMGSTASLGTFSMIFIMYESSQLSFNLGAATTTMSKPIYSRTIKQFV